jgi:hypothetical protein
MPLLGSLMNVPEKLWTSKHQLLGLMHVLRRPVEIAGESGPFGPGFELTYSNILPKLSECIDLLRNSVRLLKQNLHQALAHGELIENLDLEATARVLAGHLAPTFSGRFVLAKTLWCCGYPGFGRLTGVFPDQTGNEVAWQAVFQLGNELKSAPGSHFKVSSASNSVQKVEVIG